MDTSPKNYNNTQSGEGRKSIETKFAIAAIVKFIRENRDLLTEHLKEVSLDPNKLFSDEFNHKVKAKLGAAEKTYLTYTLVVIDILFKSGCFGKEGEKFDYDSRRLIGWRNIFSNINLDGASIAILTGVIAELASKDVRQGHINTLKEILESLPTLRKRILGGTLTVGLLYNIIKAHIEDANK